MQYFRLFSRLHLLWAALLALALTAACGGGTTAPPPTQPGDDPPPPGGGPTQPAAEFVFAANSGSGNIASLRIQENGSLAAVSGSPFASMTGPRRLAFLTGARRLVAAGQGASGDLRAYRVTSAGALEEDGVHHLGADHEFLAAFPADNEIYTRRTTTGLARFRYSNGQFQPQQTLDTADPSGGTVFELAADPQGRFLLAHVVFRESSQIWTLSRDLERRSAATIEPDRPGGMAVHPSGNFVFVVIGHTLRVFSLNAQGELNDTGHAAATGNTPRDVLAHPNGNFVFVANQQSATVSMYSVAGNGALSAVAGSPFAAGAGARGLTLSPGGEFLYVSNHGAGSVSGFRIANSRLEPLSGSPYSTGGSAPLGLAAGRP